MFKQILINSSKLYRFYSTTTKEPLVLLEKHLGKDGKYNGVQIMKLNKPSAMNALNWEMGDDFKRLVAELEQDSTLRALVLTGAGDRAFSAGGDLQFLRERVNETPDQNAKIMEKFYNTYLSIRRVPVPIISAINGHAIGAGLCLALATDIRVASTKAKLGVTFVDIGIHGGMGSSHFLPRLVGHQVAARMLLTGDVILGEEAKRLGLVLDCVEPDQLMPVCLEMAERIATKNTIAVRSNTKTLRNIQNVGLDLSLNREADAQSQCYADKEYLKSPIFDKK
ncbi:enoyl-CoA hydratase [Tieghemostelium lacteum]|uniref:Enoyl-CoA hydratase n=1 Tax=Tieghemostelium lacteum TaxID=361077 RepID=A0A151Z5V1_TIELA|nr:enoyl-CoA hydratase [Tieghemostelium lacteum]|eukprot:KYQ89331.1 enoyl-CoA hydratase [Tieghemostelium lacteum]